MSRKAAATKPPRQIGCLGALHSLEERPILKNRVEISCPQILMCFAPSSHAHTGHSPKSTLRPEMNHVHVANPYTPICRQYRARTASPRLDLEMRGWTAAPHQESPSAASREAFCRRGARRRNQACDKVRTDRYRYAAPLDAYPCTSIPCIGHSSVVGA